MTALTPTTSDVYLAGQLPNLGAHQLIVELPDSVDTDDTFAVDLTRYGGKSDGFLGCLGFIHTTSNDIIIAEQPSATAVVSGTLTITVGGTGADNQKRTYLIYYK